jgi:hypothetical protein
MLLYLRKGKRDARGRAMDRGRAQIVSVEMPNGKVVQVQATVPGGEMEIGITDRLPSFEEITDAIEGISSAMLSTLEKVSPRKASVEFGLEVSFKEGQLTALLVQGGGTASINITLEWGDGE